MDLSSQNDRLTLLEKQLSEQQAAFDRVKAQLELIQSEVLQKQFELTQLNHPSFFQRRFGNLRKKKDAAWAAYQEAVLVLEQAKFDFSEQRQLLARLQADYQDLLAAK